MDYQRMNSYRVSEACDERKVYSPSNVNKSPDFVSTRDSVVTTMPALERIQLIWNALTERLRSVFASSQSVVFNIEATYDVTVSTDGTSTSVGQCEETECVAGAAQSEGCSVPTKCKTTNQTLHAQFSSRCIAINGSQTQTDESILTEECLTVVLKSHPKLEEVSHLVITRHTHLTSIPVFIGKLMNLTTLDLTGNKLHDLPWAIVYLRKLKILNLSHNQFYTVPPTVGRLTSLEQLLLNSNCLEYLPTSLLHLEKLKILQVSENKELIAPPLAVCKLGLDAVFGHLRKRSSRRNLWSDSTHYYSLQSCDGSTDSQVKVKSLLEICVATVLQFNIDFFSQSYFPPPLKKHLYDRSKVKMAAVKLAKCSECRAYFSSEAYFDGHDCRR